MGISQMDRWTHSYLVPAFKVNGDPWSHVLCKKQQIKVVAKIFYRYTQMCLTLMEQLGSNLRLDDDSRGEQRIIKEIES